jgi:hypothetical protein
MDTPSCWGHAAGVQSSATRPSLLMHTLCAESADCDRVLTTVGGCTSSPRPPRRDSDPTVALVYCVVGGLMTLAFFAHRL